MFLQAQQTINPTIEDFTFIREMVREIISEEIQSEATIEPQSFDDCLREFVEVKWGEIKTKPEVIAKINEIFSKCNVELINYQTFKSQLRTDAEKKAAPKITDHKIDDGILFALFNRYNGKIQLVVNDDFISNYGKFLLVGIIILKYQ